METFRDFRENAENKFVIEDPIIQEVTIIQRIWMGRPNPSDRFTMTLELAGCSINPDIIKKMMTMIPSIRVVINGLPLETGGIIKSEGDYYYEGKFEPTQGRRTT
jgi:hypothetical protein